MSHREQLTTRKVQKANAHRTFVKRWLKCLLNHIIKGREMQWTEYHYPRIGSNRVVSKFLWFPTGLCVDEPSHVCRIWKWWQNACFVQVYNYFGEGGPYWQNNRWVNAPLKKSESANTSANNASTPCVSCSFFRKTCRRLPTFAVITECTAYTQRASG